MSHLGGGANARSCILRVSGSCILGVSGFLFFVAGLLGVVLPSSLYGDLYVEYRETWESETRGGHRSGVTHRDTLRTWRRSDRAACVQLRRRWILRFDRGLLWEECSDAVPRELSLAALRQASSDAMAASQVRRTELETELARLAHDTERATWVRRDLAALTVAPHPTKLRTEDVAGHSCTRWAVESGARRLEVWTCTTLESTVDQLRAGLGFDVDSKTANLMASFIDVKGVWLKTVHEDAEVYLDIRLRPMPAYAHMPRWNRVIRVATLVSTEPVPDTMFETPPGPGSSLPMIPSRSGSGSADGSGR